MSVSGVVMALSFLAIFVGMALGGDDPVAQLRGYTVCGLGGVGLLSAFRHIFFPGALRDHRSELGFANDTFFEMEAGFANLAFGVAALVTGFADWGVHAMATVAIAYGIYLSGAAVTHLLAGWRTGTLRRAFLYGVLTLGLVGTAVARVIPAL